MSAAVSAGSHDARTRSCSAITHATPAAPGTHAPSTDGAPSTAADPPSGSLARGAAQPTATTTSVAIGNVRVREVRESDERMAGGPAEEQSADQDHLADVLAVLQVVVRGRRALGV